MTSLFAEKEREKPTSAMSGVARRNRMDDYVKSASGGKKKPKKEK